jgi:pyrroloquinoline quinone (PQQ) biosynthesis protein C
MLMISSREATLARPVVDNSVHTVEHDAACDVDMWLNGLIAESICHRAVDHPYLQRLAKGDFPDIQWALRDYATQYYGYSAHFPRYLTAAISRLQNPDHRQLLIHNLLEECGQLDRDERAALERTGIDPAWIDGVPHPRLFRSLQEHLGAAPFDETDHRSLEVICWREMFLNTLAHGSCAEAIGALGPGTEGIVKYFYRYLLEAMKRFSGLARQHYVFFELHCLVDDGHTEALNQIARDLAGTPEGRRELRKGMLKALNLRVAFWDWMLQRATNPAAFRPS